jgi:hypothetical protein
MLAVDEELKKGAWMPEEVRRRWLERAGPGRTHLRQGVIKQRDREAGADSSPSENAGCAASPPG